MGHFYYFEIVLHGLWSTFEKQVRLVPILDLLLVHLLLLCSPSKAVLCQLPGKLPRPAEKRWPKIYHFYFEKCFPIQL